MTKKKVLILFGGKSGEHEVSIVSAKSVYQALDRNKYDVVLVGINKEGRWLLPDESRLLAQSSNPKLVTLNATETSVAMLPYRSSEGLVAASAPSASPSPGGLKFDVVLPILHGPNGEDGTMQGLLELADVPYVGSGVLGSSVCMDKDMTKRVLRDAGLPIVPYLSLKRSAFEASAEEHLAQAEAELGYPYFVKPANMGSSVGVGKVRSRAEAMEKISKAFDYDTKVLIERAVSARELECAVLGNDHPQASVVGEIVPHGEFYSYESKYVDENGAELLIPAPDLSPAQMKTLQRMAVQAFEVLECRGMARVDFFQDKVSGEFYINELNTIPGFTPVSMYPKLWEATGLSYAHLIDRLIELACERHAEKARNQSSF